MEKILPPPAAPLTHKQKEDLFESAKRVFEGKPLPDALEIQCVLLAATLSQGSANKEEAYNRFFGLGAKLTFGATSILGLIKHHLDRFAGETIIVSGAEAMREMGKLTQ